MGNSSAILAPTSWSAEAGRIMTLSSVIKPFSSNVSLSTPSTCFPATSVANSRIATRSFERRFGLADHVKVRSADLDDGLLSIDLVREIPEAMRPRKISLGGGEQQSIEADSRKVDARKDESVDA